MVANWTDLLVYLKYVCFFSVVSVPENYNSLSAYYVRGLFVQTSYIWVKNLGWVGWGGVGGGDLNFINQWGEPRKGGKQKGKERGDYHFWLKFSGGEPWRKLWIWTGKILYSFLSNCMNIRFLLFWMFLNQLITTSVSLHGWTADKDLTLVLIFSI